VIPKVVGEFLRKQVYKQLRAEVKLSCGAAWIRSKGVQNANLGEQREVPEAVAKCLHTAAMILDLK
jgi:hypothetical protein